MHIEKGRVLRSKNEDSITNKTSRTEEIDKRVLRGYATKSQDLGGAAQAAVGNASERAKDLWSEIRMP